MMNSQKNTYYWDPVTQSCTPELVSEITNNNKKLQEKFQRLKHDPGKVKRNLILLALFGIIIFIVGEAFVFLEVFSSLSEEGENVIMPLILGAVPFFIYWGYIQELQKDLVSYLVAQKFGWLYDPLKNYERWQSLRTLYPEVFEKGNQGQYIENQFWGKADNGKDFWLGNFHYEIRAGKSTSHYLFRIYAFPLSKKVPADFILSPQNAFTKLRARFSSKTITTEYNKFNEEFHIEYRGDRGLMGADILQTLAPDVMDLLHQYEQKNKDFQMVFKENTVLVSIKDGLKIKHTNFAKAIELNDKDAEYIQEQIDTSISLAEKILPKIE